MPTVPVTGSPSVATRPLPDLRTSAESFGAAPAAPDLSGLADQVHAIWQDEKRKADQVAVLGAAGQVSQLETDLATQTRQKLGTNAFTAPEDVQKVWGDRVAKIGSSLTNDDQKLAFQNIVQSHWSSLDSMVQGHVAGQRRVVDDDRTNSYMASEANAAIQNFTDPQRVALSVANQQAAIRDHAKRNGLPEEWVTAHTLEAASKTHVAVIDRLLANDQDIAAKKYYDAVKDQIEGHEAVQVDKALEIGSSRVESQHEAEKIMGTAKTRAEAIEMADKIDNPKVQDLTRQRVERLWQQKDANAREVEAARMQKATEIVRQTRDFNRIPPSMLVGMSVSDQDALLSFSKKLNESPTISTDRQRFNDLTKMFSDPKQRDAAIKHDLNRDSALLSDADYKHFSELQGGLIKGDEATAKKLNGIYTNDQIVESGLKATGLLDAAGVSTADRKAHEVTVNGLKQTINQQVEDLEQHAKRPATAKEVTDITNEVLTQHVISTPGRFWGTNEAKKRLDEMGPNDQLIITAKDIPRADYRAIVQHMRAQGLPLTDDAVIAEYKKSLMALRRRGQR